MWEREEGQNGLPAKAENDERFAAVAVCPSATGQGCDVFPDKLEYLGLRVYRYDF